MFTTEVIRVILLGEPQTGKSSFIRRNLTGEFDEKYIPTQGCELHKLKFWTNHGPQMFEILDMGIGNPDQYLATAHGAMVFHDHSNKYTYTCVPFWIELVTKLAPDIPVITICHKSDLKKRIIKPKKIKFSRSSTVQHYDVSSRSNFQLEVPFLSLARKITKLSDLEFKIPEFSFVPTITLSQLAEFETELAAISLNSVDL